jgi:alpha-beta hydrolase superfamily lysophospholipase
MEPSLLQDVAWIGDGYLEGRPRGVVLVFHGLGITALKSGPEADEYQWARDGGLVVYPYYGPWSWMNREARAFVDDLVDAVYTEFGLAADAPLICVGGSMGGLSALLYTRYARRPVDACLALYPVCDLAYHFRERRDLPRTILHAFRGYGEPLAELLTEHSPLALVGGMPDIPYLIVHGDKDYAVNKTHHSDRLVAALRAATRDVTYIEVPGMGHLGPLPPDVLQRTIAFVSGRLCQAERQDSQRGGSS